MRRPTSVVWNPVPPLIPVIADAVKVTPDPEAAPGVIVVVVIFSSWYGPSVKVMSVIVQLAWPVLLIFRGLYEG